jgi:hypothetical protein
MASSHRGMHLGIARRTSVSVALMLVVSMAGLTTVTATASSNDGASKLELYTATVDATTLQDLRAGGYDITSVETADEGTRIELVLSRVDRNQLRREGVDLSLVRDEQGRTQSERFALQEAEGFNVWRSFDEEGGIRDEMYEIAADNPGLVELEVLGTTPQNREYIALKVTEDAGATPDGSRPAVLYASTYHAREWISTEVNRRLLHWYLDQYEAGNSAVQDLLGSTELWFVLVHNPDGYEYTFDAERLWRKNLRDNDGDGNITSFDGVDLNRNHAEHWNYDEEGSSGQFSDETYRGPSADSEPETQAMVDLFDKVPFEFAISYHSYGELLLYSQGWQVQTPAADDPIYVALTGTDNDPAVRGFDPGVGADLYTTNGEFTDWAHGVRGTPAWTPELSEGCAGCGFVFPDDERLVQAHFERNLQFALNVAMSAQDPDDPVSHAGIDTQDFYLDVSKIDPWKTNNPSSDLDVDVSYAGGSSQPVEVLAKTALGSVSLNYSINGGAVQTASTSPAPDGEVFGGNNAYNVYYEYLRGNIPELSVNDNVEYWFTSGGSSSEHAKFKVVESDDADVLVVAAEDRTGLSNPGGYANTKASGSPNFLSYYANALTTNGVQFDVYDVDARGREAPDHLGVLSHYDAVIWYTGNDFVTRQSGRGPGNVDRLANDMILEMRAFLNEGGSLLYTGKYAGAVESGVAGGQYYDPVANIRCVSAGGHVNRRCQLFSDKNDFLQYYLGAYIYNDDAGTGPTGPFPINGVEDPFTGLDWLLNGEDSADNQDHTASFVTTSSILPEADYPQFASDAPAVWDTGASGAFEPFDGTKYMYSQRGDVSYKRLMRTIDLTGVTAGDAPTLKFRFSYDTEPDWDFVFVEAHTVGQDDWTTLPEANEKTAQDTGESCPEGWFELHPWLERYQGADCSGGNATTGGEWWADSGRSAGWEQWEIDISDYAGSQVELSISYASDWAVQGLGAFVDKVEVSTGEGDTSFEDDLDPMDGWTIPGPPEGSDPNPNDWLRTGSVGLEEGAAVSTDDTLYFGFGFEGIRGVGARTSVMDRIINHLLN